MRRRRDGQELGEALDGPDDERLEEQIHGPPASDPDARVSVDPKPGRVAPGPDDRVYRKVRDRSRERATVGPGDGG